MLWACVLFNSMGTVVCGGFAVQGIGNRKAMIALAVANLLFLIRAVVLLSA